MRKMATAGNGAMLRKTSYEACRWIMHDLTLPNLNHVLRTPSIFTSLTSYFIRFIFCCYWIVRIDSHRCSRRRSAVAAKNKTNNALAFACWSRTNPCLQATPCSGGRGIVTCDYGCAGDMCALTDPLRSKFSAYRSRVCIVPEHATVGDKLEMFVETRRTSSQ